ncbi:MAG: right-handed parallel beta-helix repeat-containing protein [Planctomycetota bacterium]
MKDTHTHTHCYSALWLLGMMAALGTLARAQEYPQPQPVLYYVDNVSGSDSTGDGSALNPWATITHALSVVNPLNQTAEIRIRGRLVGGTPEPYDNVGSPSETFPLTPARGVSLMRDPFGSDPGAPVIIRRGTGTSAPILVRLGQGGLSDYSRTVLRHLKFENAESAAVEVAPQANDQTLAPTIELCTFDTNVAGVVAMSGRTPAGSLLTGTAVAPTIRNTTFTFTQLGLVTPVSHVELLAYTDMSNVTQGTVQACTLTMDSTLAGQGNGLQHAVRMHAQNGAQVSTALTSDQINGKATAIVTGRYGIKYGVKATTTQGATMPFTLSGGSVRYCGKDGVFLSDSNNAGGGTTAQPRIEHAVIAHNGNGYPSSGAYSEIHGSGIVIESNLGRLSPTIEDNNASGSGSIEGNRNHNIAVRAVGTLGVLCAPVIKNNTIFEAERGNGILLFGDNGRVTGRVDSNKIKWSDHHGIHVAAIDRNPQGQQASVATEIVNNAISYNEWDGIHVERVSPRGPPAAQAHPTITHNTVCYNYFIGLANVDPFGQFNAGMLVYNSIFWYNGPDLDGTDSLNGQVQFCDWNTGDTNDGSYYNLQVTPHFYDADFHLDPAYPGLIDKATETPPAAPLVDFEGDNRTIDFDGIDTTTDNDMGIDEVSN